MWAVVDCGIPQAPANGSVTVSGTTFNSTATYSCDSGYILHGNITRTCLETGLWSTSSPTCTGITLYSRILAHQPLITYTPGERKYILVYVEGGSPHVPGLLHHSALVLRGPCNEAPCKGHVRGESRPVSHQ